MLFGAGWAWLTYDRFAFWATLLLLPFLGTFVLMLRSVPRFVFAVYGVALALTAFVIGFMPSWLPTQPRQLDMRPIVEFLAQGDHVKYRYLTFGFGDQLALLSRLTRASTIDGSYHTARTLPVLRTSGIGQVDTSYWFRDGLTALGPILIKSSEYGVRWGFVELEAYEPVLESNGWLEVTTLANQVNVWENPNAILPTVVKPPDESAFEQFSWGVFPMLSLVVSGGLALRRYWFKTSIRVFTILQTFAVGLLPFSLTFWYFRPLFAFPHPRVYFTYTNALVFLSDVLAFIAILAWLGQKTLVIPKISFPIRLNKWISNPVSWLFGLCLLATLSTFWSLDWRISLYTSLQLWLLFALFLSLRDTPAALRWFVLGSCAALFTQVVIGVWQFTAQSTFVNHPLGSIWPGDLVPSISGASIVQGANGLRWLRAYGTFPHPNLLGGFGLALLAGPLILFLTSTRWKIPLLVLYGLGIGLLTLTFSRGAWLGFTILFVVLLFHPKVISIRKILPALIMMLVVVGVLLALFSPLFFTRVTENQAQTEQVSSYTRLWLIQRTLELIRQRPLLGSGVETFSLALSNHVAQFYKIEPIHNIPLLVMSELGPAGLLLLAGLVVLLLRGAWKATSTSAIVLSGILLGLLTISIFDHYIWTLAPGRTLLFTMVGLWAGNMDADERSS
jgi:O-antigen ligase